jgi:release factor glutamine methyltransferase
VDSPGLDARLLLADAAGLDMAALMARGDEALAELARTRFDAHIKARIGGKSIARILGHREFWGLSFGLNEATLEPRPETEILVEAVLAEVRLRFAPDLAICDLGTGSGAILIALLTELPEARGVGTDIAQAALDMAEMNADRLGVGSRARFALCEFSTGPYGLFDVIVSNPPYIRSAEIQGLAREVRDHDPHVALDGGPDGLAAYRTIIARAPELLAQNGLLALEVGYDQGEAVAALCRAGGWHDVAIRADLAGAGRVVTATANNASETRGKRAKKALGNLDVSG